MRTALDRMSAVLGWLCGASVDLRHCAAVRYSMITKVDAGFDKDHAETRS
jgi:hypothetical protein